MEMNFVEEHEVVIHGWVFDISRLAPDQSKFKVDHDMYEHLAKLGGQDLSEAIKKDDVTGSAVSSLYQKGKRLIVGKIKSDRPLREIPQGELYKHCEANTTTCTWVAVKGQVYDVTSAFPPLLFSKIQSCSPWCRRPFQLTLLCFPF